MTYTCSHDDSHSYTEPIPALGHDMVVKQRVEPTKEADGFEIAACARCSFATNTVLPKITYTLGDINNDGVINAKDVTILRRALAGGYGIAVPDAAAADVNKDGTINAKDVTHLRRALAGGYGITLS